MRYLLLLVLAVIVVCTAIGVVPKPNFMPAWLFFALSWGVVGTLWWWVGRATDWCRQPRINDDARLEHGR